MKKQDFLMTLFYFFLFFSIAISFAAGIKLAKNNFEKEMTLLHAACSDWRQITGWWIDSGPVGKKSRFDARTVCVAAESKAENPVMLDLSDAELVGYIENPRRD